jgi:trehalose 6-phosphate synthase/phosphatase
MYHINNLIFIGMHIQLLKKLFEYYIILYYIPIIVRKEVLEGLLGADLIGFQTYSFARHFLQTCSRLLSLETSPKGIQLENTAVNVGIFPIGIDTKGLNKKRKDPEVANWVEMLREKYAGMKLIVARDKLDYIKGVRQKMLAFERFLNVYPQYVGKVIISYALCSITCQFFFLEIMEYLTFIFLTC